MAKQSRPGPKAGCPHCGEALVRASSSPDAQSPPQGPRRRRLPWELELTNESRFGVQDGLSLFDSEHFDAAKSDARAAHLLVEGTGAGFGACLP